MRKGKARERRVERCVVEACAGGKAGEQVCGACVCKAKVRGRREEMKERAGKSASERGGAKRCEEGKGQKLGQAGVKGGE